MSGNGGDLNGSSLDPPGIENKSQNRLLALDQPERCSGWVLTEYHQSDRSPAQAMSDQRAGWCCIDRLSWQRLPGLGAGFQEITERGP